jgi:hypothetical protein
MECRELTALAVDGLLGELDDERRREASDHAAACESCRQELDRIDRTWRALGEDPDASVTSEFRRRTLALLEDEMIRSRVREFRPKRRWIPGLAHAAGWILAGVLGYAVARRGVPDSASPRLPAAPDPRALEAGALSNVSFKPADASGRIGVSFDVSSRQTVRGRPEDPAMARLLAYLVSRGAQTAGEKSRAIELVSSQYGARVAPASEEIVRALTTTLRKDQNPGVRKKAADALAGFRLTPEVRAAFLDALRQDPNPAVRLTAVEALAAAAREAPDPRTIESLRQKAADPSENGFVRTRAASALKSIEF